MASDRMAWRGKTAARSAPESCLDRVDTANAKTDGSWAHNTWAAKHGDRKALDET